MENSSEDDMADHLKTSNQMLVTLNETQIKQSMRRIVPGDISSLTNTALHFDQTPTDTTNFHNFTTLKAAHFMKKGVKNQEFGFYTKSEMMVR